MEERFMGPRRGMLGIRVALIAFGAVLGIVLLLSGDVIIGGLLLVMSVLRATMVGHVFRRRQAMQARRARRWTPPPPPPATPTTSPWG
jgi:hypothetical protein